MTETPSGSRAAPATTAVAHHRVSSLTGDRLCIRCAYNLVGQPILREPHYDMLIVRCPECATVASVQEYPLLGPWAGRWAAVAAGLWLLFLMAFWIGTGAMIFGFSVGVGEWSADKLSQVFYHDYAAWEQTQRATVALNTATRPVGVLAAQPSTAYQVWWEGLDLQPFINSKGGWLTLIDWEALLLWIPLGLLSFVCGCVWAVMLLANKTRARLLWGVCIMAVAVAFSIIPLVDWLADGSNSYGNISRQILGPIFMGLSLAFGGMCLLIGLVVGRTAIRWLLVLLLPPRLRSPLAMFWLADGLQPPSTT